MSVPNVNFFIGYVDSLKGKSSADEYVKNNFEARRFYSSGKDYDYVKYVATGSKEKLDYIAYSGNNEKSHGIFNPNGLMSAQDIKELRNKLRKTASPIWHGVISFTEDFGNQFCDNYEKAYELMRTEFPKFFKAAGLNPDNIEWFAGLHENTDNKHIHFSFFEKTPLRKKQNSKKLCYSNGFIVQKAINDFKVKVELRLKNYTNDISIARKSITRTTEKLLNTGDYMEKLKSLIIILPRKGRMSYDSKNMQEYRPYIDSIINTIIKANKNLKYKFDNFYDLLGKRDNQIIQAYTKLKIDYTDKLMRDKCIKDIYRRLGNLVLFMAKEIRAEQAKLDTNTRNRLLQKRIDKLKRKALIKKCMQLNDLVDQEIMNAFKEYLDKLDEANYNRLKEEGLID